MTFQNPIQNMKKLGALKRTSGEVPVKYMLLSTFQELIRGSQGVILKNKIEGPLVRHAGLLYSNSC